MTPSTFQPRDFTEFIGPAADIALILARKCVTLKTAHSPVKLLLYGQPGTGKSHLANLMALTLSGSAFAVEEYNGKQITIETVKDWMLGIGYASLFGDYSVRIVNELDLMSRDAQNLLLSYLDKLPSHRAFIGTSNMQLDLLQERFQTRLQQFKIEAPSTEEITDWLCKRWKVPLQWAQRIAVGSGGNVRAALLDTQSYFDSVID